MIEGTDLKKVNYTVKYGPSTGVFEEKINWKIKETY